MPETILSHYRVLGELGRGGMGVLYKAHDQRLDRTVAIKVLRPELTMSAERRQRFTREAKAASALNHPNIVTIYDVDRGQLDGHDHDVIVMEFIDGPSLERTLQAGRLDVDRALHIAGGVAEALAAAHAAGIVHRDLKPANIMITVRGDAKLVDFGLAKLVEVSSSAETKLVDLHTSEGSVLGTAAYMSPEQAIGGPVDQRTDVFSFGTVLYEMLTGERPFSGDSVSSTRMAVVSQSPAPIRTLRADVPAGLAAITERCLDKRPEQRFASGEELATALRRLRDGRTKAFALSRRTLAGLGAAVIVLIAAVSWYGYQSSRLRWARFEALPAIERLSEQERFVEAFDLLQRVRPVLEGQPEFQRLWNTLTLSTEITTEPSAATVSWMPYAARTDQWSHAGTAPLRLHVPMSLIRFRVEKAGFEPVEVARWGAPTVSVELKGRHDVPPGMVFVPAGTVTIAGRQVRRGAFWFDKFEVTNRRYKSFIDAGGYRESKYWKEPFRFDDRELNLREAMDLFRDKTGQPGPSTWELSTYPSGQDDHPVGGVSWYEAAAFAAFEEKSVPTSWHWASAADVFSPVVVMDLSNYGGTGPAAVGTYRGLGPYGTYDMAGNVREWAWNGTGGKRSSMGGGWNDATYAYRTRYAYSPFDRSAMNGIRLAKYLDPVAPQLLAPIDLTWRDYSKERPVDDTTFVLYRGLYGYDPTPLGATVEAHESGSADWKIERVVYAAGYEGKRLPADLYLPTRGRPPFQAVVYFPGSMAQGGSRVADMNLRFIDFLVKSGRAVIYPTYNSTFERSLAPRPPQGSHGYRDLVIQNAKEVRRTVDYLGSRADIDAEKIAYYGLSWGAREGLNFTALEPRFKASVLLAGGLDSNSFAPEIDMINFAPRVRVPTLMVNGREDFRFPYAESQLPMFRLLGASEKSHVVLKSGHMPTRLDIIKPILDWLDKYLGRVAPT